MHWSIWTNPHGTHTASGASLTAPTASPGRTAEDGSGKEGRAVRKIGCEARAHAATRSTEDSSKEAAYAATHGVARGLRLAAGHHDQVLAILDAGGEGSWPELVAEMVFDGISGRRGAEPTPNAALKVWQRVRRDIEGADHAPRPRRKPPSKVPRDWRPQLALPRTRPGPSAADADKPYDPLERIAEIRREMKARSGRKE